MGLKIKLPVIFTGDKFEQFKQDMKKEKEEAVANTSNNLHREFREEMEGMKAMLQSSNISTISSDPFYKTLYATCFEGQTEETAIKKESKFMRKVIEYTRSKGYMTVYKSPLDREQPDEVRKYAQRIAYIRAIEDPIIGSVVDSLQRFIMGRGVKFNCVDYRVQNVLEDFWAKNKMEVRSKKMVWLWIAESELFPLYFINEKTGEVKVREVQPAEIEHVETDPNDKDSILSYKRVFMQQEEDDISGGQFKTQYYADINYKFPNKEKGLAKSVYEGRENWQGKFKLIQFVKFMKNREVRSRVYLERGMRWAEFYKNWLIDRVIINHEKGRVVWILEVTGRDPEVWERYKPAPAGGLTKLSTPDRKWIPTNAKINADDVKEDGLALLHQIAAGYSIPIHVLLQKIDTAVYASIRKSETPFSQNILDLQDTTSEDMFEPMFRLVIRAAISYGTRLPKTIKIRKFIQEYLISIFKSKHNDYKQKKISETEMLEYIKILLDEFVEEFKDNDPFMGNYEVSDQILKECQSLQEDCLKDSIRLFESEKSKVNKKLLKKAYKMFDQGFLITVNTEDVPIDITFPDIIKEDMLDTAKVLEIHDRTRLASKATLRTKAGYNSEREKYLLEKEQEEEIENASEGKEDKTNKKPNENKEK